MANEEAPRIVSADRFEDFLIVGFSNGRGGRYSAALLFSILSQCEELYEPVTAADFDEPDGAK